MMPCSGCVGALVQSVYKNTGETEREAGTLPARECSWPFRDSMRPVGAGKDQMAGPLVDAGISQQGDQQVKPSPLVEARGTERGTRASSVAEEPSQWGDTSVSEKLCKEEVVSPVMPRRGLSESGLCETGSRAVKSVIPKKGPNCVYRGLSIVVAGFRLNFTTSANGLIERGLKIVPGTSEAKDQHQRRIIPRPETTGWRGESSDTFPGSRSTPIQNGRPTRRRG